jgi:type IV pilus assembly protein PilB
MIGEIRDEETAEIAVRSAITGHIVFSTLHTNDAPGAILRLQDMGIDNYLVADALAGVIAQRLVKRLCPACKKKGRITPKELEILGLTDENLTVARPQGCRFCNNTGYKGRIAVHEVMYVNDTIKAAITNERNLDVLRKLAADNGMNTLWESCRTLVLKGITSIQELMYLNAE